jgi:hypothetical protein
MPTKYLGARLMRAAQTENPWTENFNHMLPFAQGLRWPKEHVSPAQRIKYWNIVPGDQVRVIRGKDKEIRTVVEINKLTNRVSARTVSSRLSFCLHSV